MSNRLSEWNAFAYKVGQHIESYTVPQYGDLPNDQLTQFSPEDCVREIQRYCNRAKSNSRGAEESLRDCLKMAHYACALYNKLSETK